MTFEPEFVRLYAIGRELYDCSSDSAYVQSRLVGMMGEPRSMTYIEATLVGTALANPWEPDLVPLYAQIGAAELAHWNFRKIWEACAVVSKTRAAHLDSIEAREIGLAITLQWMWIQSGRPASELPEPANAAISLSGQFLSAANAKAIGRHYLSAKAERRLSGEIQEIAAGLREGNYSAAQCLERFALLHERVSVHGH